MKKSTDQDKSTSRRKFLEKSLTGLTGVAIGLAATEVLMSESPAVETVKMLTPNGELVEVDKRFLPPMCGKPQPVSNEKLRQWMQKDS